MSIFYIYSVCYDISISHVYYSYTIIAFWYTYILYKCVCYICTIQYRFLSISKSHSLLIQLDYIGKNILFKFVFFLSQGYQIPECFVGQRAKYM